MKNTLHTALLLGIAAVAAHANPLPGVALSGAPVLTVTGGYSQAAPLQATITITNTSGRALRLGLQRQVRTEVPGSENNFCFGTGCYPPNVGTAPAPITVANNGTDNSMILDYTPNNHAGVTVVRYAVYEAGTQDSTYLTVRFDATRPLATAATRAPESVLGLPYPNPATAGAAGVRLSYQLPANAGPGSRLALISLADGRHVRDLSLAVRPVGGVIPPAEVVGAGTVVLQLEGLSGGLYAAVLLDGRGRLLAARRLLVQ